MYDYNELKCQLNAGLTHIECPVNGCDTVVPRMTKDGKNLNSRLEDKVEFLCEKHRIIISPSTFEYLDETDNLLWKDTDDLNLLSIVKTVKRESRMVRENSEDAVTWNVMRFLERTGLIGRCLEEWTQSPIEKPEIIYWSYCQKEKKTWSWLNKARKEFGEDLNRGSEPDVIVLTKAALFFVEAKVMASNETTPTDKTNLKKYLVGGEEWFNIVFQASYQTIAIEKRKYELLRFWLLGTWIASQLGIDFYLINLVPVNRETDIEKEFKPLIIEDDRRKFKRSVWEDIYRLVSSSTSAEAKTLKDYFENKTCGYDGDGKLQRMFKV